MPVAERRNIKTEDDWHSRPRCTCYSRRTTARKGRESRKRRGREPHFAEMLQSCASQARFAERNLITGWLSSSSSSCWYVARFIAVGAAPGRARLATTAQRNDHREPSKRSDQQLVVRNLG